MKNYPQFGSRHIWMCTGCASRAGLGSVQRVCPVSGCSDFPGTFAVVWFPGYARRSLQLHKGGGCRVRISSQERSKGFLSRCSAHDYCPGGKKVNSKVTVNALEDILAGLPEAGKEIESLYHFNKDGFCFLVHLALLPQESTTVFVLWTCLSLHLPDVAPKLPFLRPGLALGKTAKKPLLVC